MSSDDAVFVAAGLCKTFGGVRAVDNVGIRLHASRVTGLIGPNGAGKSTLVDLLSGQQRTEAGSLVYRGNDVTRLAAHQLARLGIARTFQTSRLTSNLTVGQALGAVAASSRHIGAWGYIVGLPWDRRRYAELRTLVDRSLAQVDLESSRREYVRDLGWEQQRRLEIARALSMDCSVLLLDEPTAGMHADSLPRFSSLVKAIAVSGVAVLLIEHNVAFMRETAHDLYAMDAGSLLTHGLVAAVLEDERVVSSYLGSVPE